MARKKAKKTTRKAPAKQTALPRGYEAIAGFGQSWPNDDTKIGDMIQGTVIEFDEVETKHGDNEVAKIETKDGTVYTFWRSATSGALFEYEEGIEVAIIYDGLGKKKGKNNPPKLFRVGIKE